MTSTTTSVPQTVCPYCDGEGDVGTNRPCPHCAGKGVGAFANVDVEAPIKVSRSTLALWAAVASAQFQRDAAGFANDPGHALVAEQFRRQQLEAERFASAVELTEAIALTD